MSAAAHRREADAAKASMLANADALKSRLAPGVLVDNAVESAREKALVVAEQTVGAAQARPALAGSVAGGLLLLLARKPLFGLFERVTGRRKPYDVETVPELDQIEGHPS
jgi:hypothetical protein